MFIPVDKMKKLREAAKNGDERAKKILRAQLENKDYSKDLDSYFAPKPELNSGNPGGPVENKKPAHTNNERLNKFLADNGVFEGDDDYEDAVNDYYNEFPEERPAEEPVLEAEPEEEIELTKDMAQGIIELISKCDQTLLMVMQNEEIDETSRKGAMTTLQEIKQTLFDAADKVKKIKQSLDKKGDLL